MPRPTRIYSIDSIQFALTKSNPPSLLVMASGRAASTGWSDIKLESLEKTLSPDGILDLAFVGVPPPEVFIPSVAPVTAHYVWKDAEGVIGVKVHARSNDLTRLILEEGPPAARAAVAGQAAAEHFAKTLALGEEHLTTLAIGEEHWPHPPTTHIVGEETPHTSIPFGEEFPPTHIAPLAENMTFTHGEHPASLPIIENPPTTVGAEIGPWGPWHDPIGPIETGGINAFGRR